MVLPDAIIWDNLRETDKEYVNMNVLGKSQFVTQLPEERSEDYRFTDPLFKQSLGKNTRSDIKSMAGEYYRVIGTRSSVEQSVKKMDFPKFAGFKHTKAWDLAKDFVWDMWGPVFRDETRFMHMEEMLPRLNLDSSPGVPWTLAGCKTKSSTLRKEEFHKYYASNPLDRMPPIWKISPKTEYYHITDIRNNKVRTFIIPPFEFLLLQKHLYESQNMAMKEKGWSAYGFNPYNGGTNRMAQKLLRNKIFIYYDVKGWDRKLPIMEAAYKLRNAYVKEEHFELAEWVAKHTCQSILLHTDGTLFQKFSGNNSGSGNTTADNIICHCYVLAYVLFNLYKGDERKVRQAVPFLFGDDNAMSIPDPGPNVDIEAVFRQCYMDFGLELDPFYVQDTLEGVEFLGFKFHYNGETWIPQYNIERLMAGYCYTITKQNPFDASLSKAWMLTLMSAGNGPEIYNRVANATQRMMDYLKDDPDPVIQSYRTAGIPSYKECLAFYNGQEVTHPFCSIFEGWLEDRKWNKNEWWESE